MWVAVTFEPFHCLAVDIQNLPSSSAGTLEEAILSFSEPETLDEYGTENKAAEKQVRLRARARARVAQSRQAAAFYRQVHCDGARVGAGYSGGLATGLSSPSQTICVLGRSAKEAAQKSQFSAEVSSAEQRYALWEQASGLRQSNTELPPDVMLTLQPAH